ncbi:MAG: M20/M25/M40 family metallo-hydrolase [Planctomycetota bacterium]
MPLPDRDLKHLVGLTGLPTAAGREDAVVAWVTRWAKRHPWVALDADAYGNLTLRDRRWLRRKSVGPIVAVAHMDHPAFVGVESHGREAVAHFRGGVKAEYFMGAAVRRWSGTKRGERGVIVRYEKDQTPPEKPLGTGPGPRVTIRFPRDARVRPDDILTWDLPDAKIGGGRLRAPACDNLAGVAAALTALERTHTRPERDAAELRVLLTRAEEIGFVGALGVCEDQSLPRDARVVVLEASKTLDHAPIGAGPIVRVGDRLSVFDAELTDGLAQAARRIADDDSTFAWQRKLMDGGACEATAFAAYGHRAACVCVPLGNYHNMNEARRRIDRESIAVADWRGMVRLLAELPATIGNPCSNPILGVRVRLSSRFAVQRAVLSRS